MSTFAPLQFNSTQAAPPTRQHTPIVRPFHRAVPSHITSVAEADTSPETRHGPDFSFSHISIDAPTQTSHDAVQSHQKNTTGLPDKLKAGIERLSGISMDDVNVHYNSSRPAQMDALAYTQGTQIHVGPGQEKHLPHEAWHVVQQKQGRVKQTMQKKGVGINDDPLLEQEADQNAIQAVDGKATHSRQTGSGINISFVGTSAIQLMDPNDVEDIYSLRPKRKSSKKREKEDYGGYESDVEPEVEDKDDDSDYEEKKEKTVDPQKSAKTREANEALAKIANRLVGKLQSLGVNVKGNKVGTTTPTIIALDVSGEKQVRGKKPFDRERQRQTLRHVATTIHQATNMDRETEEIQAAVSKDDPTLLGVAANENGTNTYLQSQLKSPEAIRANARKVLKNPGKGQNTHKAIRGQRHAAKLLRDKHKEFKKFTKVAVPQQTEKSHIHAEIRLLNEGFIDAAGVRRPCVACAITLTKSGQKVESVGPLWLSIGSLKPILNTMDIDVNDTKELTDDQVDALANTVAAYMKKSFLTAVDNAAPTADYGTDSESEIDTDVDSDVSKEDMELIKTAKQQIQAVKQQAETAKQQKKKSKKNTSRSKRTKSSDTL